MSRIIAGAAGGLRLQSVPGQGTRPTTDRVKESLFARLEAWGMLHEARVLDLFAGSGALGCEAASRGAAAVTLVERHPPAVRACRANAAVVHRALGRDDVVAVHQGAVAAYLADPAAGPWDLVLADPPYPLGERELTAVLAALVGRLGEGGVVVVERSSRSPEPAWPSGLRRFEQKRHGETTTWFAETALTSAPPPGAPR
ncbi:16S rRNA (guanine(966)-N(2))-methyltransferase RsmD [Kocuria turfanensis]|uniref:Methyltransferase n=1 Tax=Kocuria turfanensis TaxID=388357 RepID=A0A512I8Y3_9MICC|nr:16S rRNA (guanine(966)-N(2))-methyltransferase RsmD [Kocuria turfanensis]GEO94165.1 methyltransferase [Kocuria turfanensis]